MRVRVFSGDIAKVEADALITAINSGGMWFGGIDDVIIRQAGGVFHSQAAAAKPLKDGQTVVAKANGHQHNAAFGNVVFVVDDLEQKLRKVVFAGLNAAADAKFKSVSLPTIRMGVMLGIVEKSKLEAVNELVEGIKLFLKAKPKSSVKSLTFVVYNDPQILKLAKVALLPLLSGD